jgi:biopolymer transport protein TolR
MPTKPEKLSAQQRSKIRHLSTPKELAPDDEGGELNIVPFLDIIMNVLMFVLATVSVTFTATVEASPRRAVPGVSSPTRPATLGLTVIVVADGFSLKARGGNVAPGCNDTGPGLAVGKVAGDYDYKALRVCAKKLKGLSPDFANDSQVIVSANPGIPYQTIISTMDAVRREDEGADLFPDVSFGLVR